jgi:hypothetical protein
MTPEKSAAQGEKVVRISYHRRMYGLGEVSLFCHGLLEDELMVVALQ